MRKFLETCCVSFVLATAVMSGYGGPAAVAAAPSVAEDPNSNPWAVSADPNALRWDMADGFVFDWESVELSSKVLKVASPNAEVYTLAISIKVLVGDPRQLVTIDIERPEVFDVRDEDGRMVEYQPGDPCPVRRYELAEWSWSSTGALPPAHGQHWHPGTLLLRLLADSNEPLPSVLSQVTGYIHALYGEVIEIDVPFDAPKGTWLHFAATPGLLFRVNKGTYPPPGSLFTRNEDAPIGLYTYNTSVKSEAGRPVMAVRDAWPWYRRDLYPFADYGIVRVELFDSEKRLARYGPIQWQSLLSDPSGSSTYPDGACCWGMAEQDNHAYDMIRHVIVVRPIEVRIPFVLTNIPVPNRLCRRSICLIRPE